MTNAQKAAAEIATKYLSEPCREVDDDGKICAWSVDPDVIANVAIIIEKHCGTAEKLLLAAAKQLVDITRGCPGNVRGGCRKFDCVGDIDKSQCWIDFWRKEAKNDRS